MQSSSARTTRVLMPRVPAIFALSIIFLLACGPAAEPGAVISREELSRRLEAGDAPLVLDVRTADEFVSGHIPGAVNIPHDELANRMDELGGAKTDEIVVHCRSGRRAAMAEEVLAGAGYTNVRDLEGHMQGWQDAGLPVE